ncbi:MAG: GTP-binding protein [Bacteroidetes bacterium]|nr:MAG: GTP-binding protein [Bacteroidota bacterium]
MTEEQRNEEINRRIDACIQKQSIVLNLTHLGLTGKEIALKRLQECKHITILRVYSNHISDTSFLQSLTQINFLYLSSNQITDIHFLLNLTNLQYLDLRYNKILDYSFLKNLIQLKFLDLRYNKISDISFLENHSSLQSLNLSRNKISNISYLQNIYSLKSLALSSNQILDISCLQSFTNLQSLDLSKNKISNISSLQNLINLKSLNMSNNRILDISFLQNLTNLKSLDLSKNKISDISILQGLTNLKSLYLSGSQISDTSFLQSLNQLQYLELSKSIISNISISFLKNFPKLQYLYLHNNPIQNIPQEIFNKNGNVLSEVRHYLEDLEKGKQKNNEVKVVFIGNGSVGKTQITKRLAEKEQFVFDSQHNSTHAITLLPTHIDCDFLPEGLQLNLWDFGGQDLYHATHRLFMQTRALFVLVWDTENEANPYHTWEGVQYKNEPLQYWLKYASHFGKGSPILVVQNKVDTEAHEDACLPPTEQARLKEEFPNITDFWQCSAKTGHNFEELTYFIGEVFSQNDTLRQDLIERELPTAWVQVRDRVRAEQTKSDGAKQIDTDTFRVWCAEADVEKSTETILQFFHDTGVFYYNKQYFVGKIILDQAWAIEAVYKVLDRSKMHYKILQKNLGRLNYEWICKIWKDYTDEERKLFINFMLSADLCFESTEKAQGLQNRVFVVPQLLKPTKPTYLETYRQDYAMHERKAISYHFLPALFIQHFIVRAHRLAKVEDMWQAGIYLAYQDQRAIVEANYDTSEIVLAYSAQSVELVQAITEELEAISQNTDIKAGENKGLARFWKNESPEAIIEKALHFLELAKVDFCFVEMDKIVIPSEFVYAYNELKQKFIHAKDDWDFDQQLATLLRDIKKQC